MDIPYMHFCSFGDLKLHQIQTHVKTIVVVCAVIHFNLLIHPLLFIQLEFLQVAISQIEF